MLLKLLSKQVKSCQFFHAAAIPALASSSLPNVASITDPNIIIIIIIM